MNPKYLLIVCFLFVLSAACAPAAPESTEAQSAGATEASNSAEETEEDHSNEDADEHGEEHSDEEHGHEDDKERRELGVHEHGAAELMIAWSGSEIAIDLQTPSYNVLGFEYTPESDEEKALLAANVAALEAGTLLQISADAGCTVVSVSVQTAFEDGHNDHDEEGHDEEGHDEEGHDEEGHDEEGHDDHGKETHSEIDVSYNLECEQPKNITSLDASQLFAQFPNFDSIDAQWVSDTQASAAELTPSNPVLELNQ